MIPLKEFLTALLPRSCQPFALAERLIARKTGGRVLSGPFQGMRYVCRSVGSALQPKVLGCYELEIQALAEAMLARGCDTVVDVGAAEGYYAAGCARRLPNARIIAFEATPEGRKLLEQLCALNGVAGRVRIMGLCDEAALAEALSGAARPLVIMDVEGAEKALLDPVKIPALRQAAILVELHEFVHRGIGAEMKRRFNLSHDITEIASRDRRIGDSPVRSVLLDRWILKHLREFRPEPMQWLALTPRESGAATP